MTGTCVFSLKVVATPMAVPGIEVAPAMRSHDLETLALFHVDTCTGGLNSATANYRNILNLLSLEETKITKNSLWP